jgi:hypothetical protein
MFIYTIYYHNWRNINTIYIYIYIYIKRLASNKIFSPSNKIHREIGRAKNLSACLYGQGRLWLQVQEKPHNCLVNFLFRSHLCVKYSYFNHFAFKRKLILFSVRLIFLHLIFETKGQSQIMRHHESKYFSVLV